MRRCSHFLILTLLLVAVPLSAQEVRGRVVDSASDRPLSQAVVSVVRGDTMIVAALSDSAGGFALDVPDAEAVRLRVEAFGYATFESGMLAYVRPEGLELDVRMEPRPLELAGLTATARSRVEDDALAGFLERRRMRAGRFLGPTEIAELQPRSGDLLIASIPGIRRDYEWGSGFYAARRSSFGTGFEPVAQGQGPEHLVYNPGIGHCLPTVYLDGEILDEGRLNSLPGGPLLSIDWYVPHTAIRAVEVYPEPRDAPASYHRGSSLRCAIVMVWTERGFGFQSAVASAGVRDGSGEREASRGDRM